jgi:hypothetical protein
MPKRPVKTDADNQYYRVEDTEWECPRSDTDPGFLSPIPGSKSVAEMLDEIQSKENDGRGISCVRTMIMYLRNGQFDSALAIRRIEGDKTRCYPAVEEKLIEFFGCRMHGRYECKDIFCARQGVRAA